MITTRVGEGAESYVLRVLAHMNDMPSIITDARDSIVCTSRFSRGINRDESIQLGCVIDNWSRRFERNCDDVKPFAARHRNFIIASVCIMRIKLCLLL